MMQNKEEECSLKFQRLAERLCDMKWISAVRADFSKLQNKEFLKSGNRKYNNWLGTFFGLHDKF